jgi:hypothetical protein
MSTLLAKIKISRECDLKYLHVLCSYGSCTPAIERVYDWPFLAGLRPLINLPVSVRIQFHTASFCFLSPDQGSICSCAGSSSR